MFNPSKAQAKNESESAEESGDDGDFTGSGDKDHSYYSKPLKSTRNRQIMIRMPDEAAEKADDPLIIAVVNSNNENVPPVPDSFNGEVTGIFIVYYFFDVYKMLQSFI